MGTENFRLAEGMVIDADSGMQLAMLTNGNGGESLPWIEGWFTSPDGHCVIEKFIVLDAGRPTYRLANEMLAYWGLKVLSAELAAVQMSPEFASRYLFPAIVHHHEQVRWN